MIEWRPIAGFPAYEVSTEGQVRRLHKRGTVKMLRWLSDDRGYPVVALSCGARGTVKRKRVHRLVAEAFIGPIENGREINHKDANKQNPRVENLEIVTQAANVAHAMSMRLFHVGDQHPLRRRPERRAKGERVGGAKLIATQVTEIRRRFAAGEEGKSLAAEFGVSAATISVACSGKTWAHLSHQPNPPAEASSPAPADGSGAAALWEAFTSARAAADSSEALE